MAKTPRKSYLDQPAPVQSVLTKSSAYTVEEEEARRQQAQQQKIAGMNSFTRGLEQGFAGVGEAYHGVDAIRQAIMGDEQGANESAERAQLYANDAAAYAPEVSSVADINDTGDALSFAAGALGQLAPSLASVILGGGAGAIVGKQLGKRLLKKQMAQRVSARGAAPTQGALGTEGARLGAQTGALSAGVGLEAGSMGSQLLNPEFDAESIFGHKMSQRERAVLALAGGGVAGGLEALPALSILGRYGLTKQLGNEMKRTFRGEIGKQALQEGTTEAAQSLVNRSVMAVADKNREVLGDEGVQELIDSFAMGAIGGGVVGGIGRAVGGPGQDPTPQLPAPDEQGQLGGPADVPLLPGPERGLTDPRAAEMEAARERARAAGANFFVDADGQIHSTASTVDSRPTTLRDRMDSFMNSLQNQELDDLDTDYVDYMDPESEYYGDPYAPLMEGGETYGPYSQAQQSDMESYFQDAPQQEGELDTEEYLTEYGPGESLAGGLPSGNAARMEGIRSGDVMPNIQYEKVVRDSRGEPIRELPFLENSKNLTAAMDKAGPDFLARDYSQVVVEEAQRRYPGDANAQRNYIENQARVISEARNVGKHKIQEGQDVLEYLSKYRVLQGADTEGGAGRGALGAVPGDLELTDDDMSQAFGEIRDELGKLVDVTKRDDDGNKMRNATGEVIIDRKYLNSERTRRQIIRSMNEDTFNEGFNQDKDIKLPGKKVLNTHSLTIAMQSKMNQGQQQGDKPLAAKAGEWFVAGLGSLAERGVIVNPKQIPDNTVIYQMGRNKITWKKAKAAMRRGQEADQDVGQLAGRRDGAPKRPFVRGQEAPSSAMPLVYRPPTQTDFANSESDTQVIRTGRNLGTKKEKVTSTRRARTGENREEAGKGVEHGTREAEEVTPIRRDKTGRARHMTMEERQGERFADDQAPADIRVNARNKIKAINKAGRGVQGARVAKDGRLAWDKNSAQLWVDLQAAGVVGNVKDFFAIPKTTVKPRFTRDGRSVRVQRLVKKLMQMKNAQIQTAKRTLDYEATNRTKAVTEQDLRELQAKEAQKNADALRNIKRKTLKEAGVAPEQLELYLPIPKQSPRNMTPAQRQRAKDAAKRRKELLAKQDAAVQRLIKMRDERRARNAKKVNEIKNQEVDDLTLGDPQKKPSKKGQAYQKWYNDPKGPRVKLEAAIAAITEKLGLERVRLATPQEIDDMIQFNADWGKKVLRGSIQGATFMAPDGSQVIYINPSIKNATTRMAVIAHEIGHAVFKDKFQKASPEIQRKVFADFQKWLKDNKDSTRGAARSSKMAFSVVKALAFDKTMISELSQDDRAYLLKFEEWFADQTARYMETQDAPRSIVGKFFKGVAAYLNRMHQQMVDGGFMPANSIKEFYDTMFVDSTDTAQTVEDTVRDTVEDRPKNRFDTLTREQIDQIRRQAKALFRKENVDKYTEEQLAEEAATIALLAGEYGKNLNFASMIYAYNNFLNASERRILARAFGTKVMQNRVRKALMDAGDARAARQVMQDPDALIAHGYQLWAAGQLQLGPKTNTMFGRLRSRIARILGVVSDSRRAANVFEAINNNTHLAREELGNTSWNFAMPNQLVNNNLQRAVAGVRALGEFVAPAFQAVFQSAYSRMASTKNPWLIKLAKEFYVPPNSQGQAQSFFEAKNQKLAEFHNRVAQILQGMTKEQKTAVAEAMASGKMSKDAEVRAVQEKLKSFMGDMRTYATKAGVRMGDRSDNAAGYWPWVFDTEALLKNPDKFISMIADTMPEEFANTIIERRRGQAVSEPKTDALGKKIPTDTFVTPQERREIAAQVYGAILHSKGLGDGPHIQDYDATGNVPYMGAHDTRILDFLKNAEGFEQFLSSDLDKTLISYIDQSVKRSEFARRFGDDGRGRVDEDGRRYPGIEDILERAKKAGMTNAEARTAKKFVQAMLGTLGGDIDPSLRKGMSYVMVYENLRLLSMSTFSSLVDVNGVFVRSGSVTDTMVGWRDAAKYMAGWIKRRKSQGKDGKTDASLLAETLGIIEDSIGKEALGYEYGGTYMSGGARAINEKWFELTGIAGFTRMTRVMATGAAQNFLKRHKMGLDKDSKRYLDELGVRAEDIQVNQDGSLKILTEAQRREASQREVERDDRVRNAVYRFVDEAILRPDSAQRPIYGSDPHFMLPFHLKGFMYSFYERILKRAWTEAAEHGRLTPIMGLSLYVPGMIAADMLRDAVKDAFGDQDDDRKDNWDLGDWTSHGLDRSGLYGPYMTLLDDSAEDYTKWGKLPGLSMAGPAAEHLVDILSMKGGMETQLARALPGQNLIRPLADSIMSE